MSNRRSRLAHLEQQAGPRGKPIVVVVERGETQEQAFVRLKIDRAKLHPDQLVVVIQN